MKNEIYKLYSRDFWIFLPNFIKIDPYNFELYRLKVGAFFETQCITLNKHFFNIVWHTLWLLVVTVQMNSLHVEIVVNID